MQSNQNNIPLNEWVTEEKEIDVMIPTVDKKGMVIGMEKGVRKVEERVQYTQAHEHQIDCGAMKHDWYIPDIHTHVAFCHTCSKRRPIRAVYEMVKDGKFLNRDTGVRID